MGMVFDRLAGRLSYVSASSVRCLLVVSLPATHMFCAACRYSISCPTHLCWRLRLYNINYDTYFYINL